MTLAIAAAAYAPALCPAMDLPDFTASTNDAITQVQEAVISEVTGGNLAVIVQVGSANVAYIDQSNANDNRAMISQITDGNTATIVQTGSGNLAVIIVH